MSYNPQTTLFATTTNNTQTSIYIIDLNSPDQAMEVAVEMTARRTGGSAGSAGDAGLFSVKALVKNIAGTPTVVQASLIGEANNLNISVDVIYVGVSGQPNGQRFAVAVTGDTNNNYSWSGSVLLQQV